MGRNIVIDFSNLDQDYQSYIRNYQAKFITQLEHLADIIKENNPRSIIAKDKIINPDNWSLKHIIPDTGRSSPDISLRLPNRDEVSAASFKEKIIPTEESESLFDFLKTKLSEARKVATKDHKRLKQLEGYIDLLNLQVRSVIAEVGALNYLSKFERHFKEIYSNPDANADAQILFDQTIHCVNQLKDALKRYSLDFLTSNAILDKHTSKDAGRLRSNVFDLYKEIKEHIDELAKNQFLMSGYIEKIKTELESAIGCFEHKNNINFALPTAGQTKTQKIRKLTQLGLGLTTVGCGVLASGCAIASFVNPTGPLVTGPVALMLTGGAISCGLAASFISIINGAENYLKFHIPPSTEEKITLVLLTSSMLVGGANAMLGSTLPVITTVASGANNAVKITYGATGIGTSVFEASTQKKMKSELTGKTEDPSPLSPGQKTPNS
ncbi:hypothetical protein Lgra_0195 [Legionella gratiana]|uniref:Uncharacterized protein n=1 Tax=Legionella gratiana TaxID=45066 RepID=A0A378JDK6_9GAMM|nr:hypothetical protein [Legionella gratiana]KTD15529.1 hypothetical protein Lgra_0195 [Legionella gratiana]STX45128.1 Uncharacterised protein [Legionella gratiana]